MGNYMGTGIKAQDAAAAASCAFIPLHALIVCQILKTESCFDILFQWVPLQKNVVFFFRYKFRSKPCGFFGIDASAAPLLDLV